MALVMRRGRVMSKLKALVYLLMHTVGRMHAQPCMQNSGVSACVSARVLLLFSHASSTHHSAMTVSNTCADCIHHALVSVSVSW
jgi:broad specificity polyphosphatase/5'/3'-nucleotidase SurE